MEKNVAVMAMYPMFVLMVFDSLPKQKSISHKPNIASIEKHYRTEQLTNTLCVILTFAWVD